jgi:hypothetical protein
VGGRVGIVVGAVVLALAAPAAAHLALEYPPSRYGADVLKEGPCGRAGGGRSTAVTALEAGSTVTVVWDEYVDHPGHFRIAFDADGDDDFADPVCLGGCTTRTPDIGRYVNASVLLDGIADTPAGGESRVTVTLPDVECDRCTLQVIQVMTDKPPYTSPGNDIYYQCADLVLRRRAPAPCAGDCDDNGQVTVDELTVAVRIALGLAPVGDCVAGDADGDGRVSVDEIVRAVAGALGSCAS